MRISSNPHVLVIRLSAMGDVAMTVPVLQQFCKTHPSAKVTVLTKAHFSPIFRGISGVSVHPALVKDRHKGLKGLWLLFVELRQLKITHVADLHFVLRSRIIGLFFRFAGVPVQVLDKDRRERKRLTRYPYKEFFPIKPMFERHVEVFHKLGFHLNCDPPSFLKPLPLSRNVGQIFKKNGRYKIGIAPFAAYSSKAYPLAMMVKVIGQLIKMAKIDVFLFGGGASERQLLEDVARGFPEQVSSVVGLFSLDQELELISNLDVMLAMDSGNGHLAANYGVPVVTVWGVTHPYAGFAPFGQPLEYSVLPDRKIFPAIPTSIYGKKYPEGYENAIGTISPNDIVEKVIQVLSI